MDKYYLANVGGLVPFSSNLVGHYGYSSSTNDIL